jgi:beta-lactamase class D
MAEWVARLDYGDAEVGDTVDRFWLDGPLEISALEQAGFVRRLTAGDLPVSARTVAILRESLPRRAHADAEVVAKTGLCGGEASSHGWLVGWVERDGAAAAHFALLLLGEADQVSTVQHARWPIALAALERAGALAAE